MEPKESDQKPNALVVDDEIDNLDLLRRVLRKKYNVFKAQSGVEALKLMEEHDFQLILTDQRMPKMTGTEFLEASLKLDPHSIRILITGYSDIESVIEAINRGSVHRYVKKPWNKDELHREIDTAVKIHDLTTENEALIAELKEKNARLEQQEKLLIQDLDEKSKEIYLMNQKLHELNEELRGQTLKDGLTGLYNHRAFKQRIEEEFSRARRIKKPLSLIFFDIDHFKIYNDTNGHPAGDALLKMMSEILTSSSRTESSDGKIRSSDIVARYGGEEFAILLPETPMEGGRIKAERIRRAIEGHVFPLMESQPAKKITVSVGVSAFPNDCETFAEMIDHADKAMYAAKRGGKNQVRLWSELKEEEKNL